MIRWRRCEWSLQNGKHRYTIVSVLSSFLVCLRNGSITIFFKHPSFLISFDNSITTTWASEEEKTLVLLISAILQFYQVYPHHLHKSVSRSLWALQCVCCPSSMCTCRKKYMRYNVSHTRRASSREQTSKHPFLLFSLLFHSLAIPVTPLVLLMSSAFEWTECSFSTSGQRQRNKASFSRQHNCCMKTKERRHSISIPILFLLSLPYQVI